MLRHQVRVEFLESLGNEITSFLRRIDRHMEKVSKSKGGEYERLRW